MTQTPTWVGTVHPSFRGSFSTVRNTITGDQYQRGDDVMMLDATLYRLWDFPVERSAGRALALRWVHDPPRLGEPNTLRCVHLQVDAGDEIISLDRICKRVLIRSLSRHVIETQRDRTEAHRAVDPRQVIEAHEGCWQCLLTQRAASYLCRGVTEGSLVVRDFVDPSVLLDNVTRHTCGATALPQRTIREVPPPMVDVVAAPPPGDASPTQDGGKAILQELQHLRASIALDGERRDQMLRHELWELKTAVKEALAGPSAPSAARGPSGGGLYGQGTLQGLLHPSKYGNCLARLLLDPSEFEGK